MFEVTWTYTHTASFDLDQIVKRVLKFMKTSANPNDVIDRQILLAVDTLDESEYFAWNEEAQRQLRQAILQRINKIQPVN